MATVNYCDRCTQKIEKLPCLMKALDRDIAICNNCWKEWLEYMGRPFYKVPSLPNRKIK